MKMQALVSQLDLIIQSHYKEQKRKGSLQQLTSISLNNTATTKVCKYRCATLAARAGAQGKRCSCKDIFSIFFFMSEKRYNVYNSFQILMVRSAYVLFCMINNLACKEA